MSVVLQYFCITNHFENLRKARDSLLRKKCMYSIYIQQLHTELQGVHGIPEIHPRAPGEEALD